jgi:lysophospholipase L1-like esterase
MKLSYLNKIISLCKNNNKSLIVFTSPFYNDNCKSDNIELARIFEENQIPYYDFSDFFKNTNSITYWKDYIHLSDKGASVFSAPFFKEIEKEIWR